MQAKIKVYCGRVWYPVSSIRYPVFGVWYLMSGIRCLASSVWHPVSGIRHWHTVSGIRSPVSGIRYLVSCIQCLISGIHEGMFNCFPCFGWNFQLSQKMLKCFLQNKIFFISLSLRRKTYRSHTFEVFLLNNLNIAFEQFYDNFSVLVPTTRVSI